MPLIPRFISELRRNLQLLRQLTAHGGNPVQFIKYRPGASGQTSSVLQLDAPAADGPLPVPPRNLWLGYGNDESSYVDSGRVDMVRMREILLRNGDNLDGCLRPVLDLGCGGGRMIRQLRSLATQTEVWGLDISGPHINWLKTHLSPPFRFALNTTIPHLPFSDGYFGLVYCGSLFTHIDDLAESWFLEVRRILGPRGILYCTVHDEHTVATLARQPYHPLAAVLENHPELSAPNPPDILVTGQDTDSNVFYRSRYLRTVLDPLFEIVEVVPNAYGYQTAWVLRTR